VRALAATAQDDLTIDELAAHAGTTTRRVRSFQTLGLLPGPALRGRTGLYGPAHRERLDAVLRLQEQGFSLESIGVLFHALETGASLAEVVGIPSPRAVPRASQWPGDTTPSRDDAELYGFSELQRAPATRRGAAGAVHPRLSVVPTTVWEESEAS
jgi:DNA-binding transcriptional MerR regulator